MPTSPKLKKMSLPNWQRIKTNPKLKENLRKRSEIVRAIREFFWEHDFIETETPILVNVPSMEPYLDPFKTKLITERGDEADAYLITSPEYAMKKLLAGGMQNIFQITRSFRNRETLGKQHNPEFTILEWYRANSDYRQIMKDTEELVHSVAKKVCKKDTIVYQDQTIDLSLPWPRLTYAQALKQYANVSYNEIESKEGLQKVMQAKGYRNLENDDWDTLLTQLFVQEVEPHLGQDKPVILYDYPASQAALATVSKNDPRFAERFEVFVAGLELCNAFNELTDAKEQLKRLAEEREQKKQMGKDVYDVDMSFIEALRSGMPPAGGNALGVDRLVMLLLDSPALGEIVWIPWYEMFNLN